MGDLTWTNDTRRLSDLIPWEHNPRQIKEAEAERLLDSLETFGQFQTIAIEPDNEIVDGHQRRAVWAAAAKYGPDFQVDVRVASRKLTEREKQQISVYAHKGAVGEFDFDILANTFEVGDLLEWGFDESELQLDWGGDENVSKGNAVFTDGQIIDAAFTFFREMGFPYRNLPVHVSMQQINKLALTEPDRLLHTTMAYHVADTYHPHRFLASAEGMKSPFEAFIDDNLFHRGLELQLRQNGEIPATYFGKLDIVSGVQACANFRPGFACYLYRKYAQQGDTVLDCSTGYGGRLVGFMASGIAGRYIGIDPNVPTHEGNLKMAQELGFADKVELYNLPAEDLDVDKVRDRCDFAFTSPPYFAKEHYSDDDTQSWKRYDTGEKWREGFLLPFMHLQFKALKPGKYALVNIADVKLRGKMYPLIDWAKQCAEAVGFEYERTDNFELTNRMGAGQKDEVAKEAVLVFFRP